MLPGLCVLVRTRMPVNQSSHGQHGSSGTTQLVAIHARRRQSLAGGGYDNRCNRTLLEDDGMDSSGPAVACSQKRTIGVIYMHLWCKLTGRITGISLFRDLIFGARLYDVARNKKREMSGRV